jgi:hypothetical protein
MLNGIPRLPMSAPRRASLLAAACVLATSGSASADADARGSEPVVDAWHDDAPVVPATTTTQRSHRGLVSGGAVLFSVSYAISLIGAGGNFALGGPRRENWLLLPGLGPLVLMAETTNPVGNVLLALDALAELGGIAMITYGLAAPSTEPVSDDATPSVAVTPMLGPGWTGVGVAARF